MKDLKKKTLRGGVARICGQCLGLVLRIGSVMILARLLDPADFGLVGMVTAVTGAFNLLRDFGLSTATIQRAIVTDEQMSMLFWINILVGAVLSVVLFALSPLVAAFYHEPRLAAVTIVLATGFLFNAAGVQHSVLLQRHMRFTALTAIESISLVVSIVLAIAMAETGFGYWALVAMTVSPPIVTTTGLWLTTKWLPGRPRRQTGLRPMLRFGGTITLNGFVVYLGYNLEKVLLGRFWGAEALGIYGRAYQLIATLWDSLNSAVGGLAFSALSRIQNDPVRFRNYFLKGYALVVASTVLISASAAVFANELIFILLGAKWGEAAPIFRLLSPTILILGLITPMGWMLFALGLVGRSLRVALVLSPLVVTGYVLGLPYGPRGVALGYSAVMILWVVPHIAWCVRGTVISLRDVLDTVKRPLLSIVPAVLVALAVRSFCSAFASPLFTLVLGGAALAGAYLLMLLYVMEQKTFYVDLWGGLMGRPPAEEKALIHA